ncbi:MAG: methyltransferase domain-containing protein [Oligoflexia bacterium]
MFRTTLDDLACLECRGTLSVVGSGSDAAQVAEGDLATDIFWGEVSCARCGAGYPILAGVLLYVRDIETTLIRHMKGITALVPDEKIPELHRGVYQEARESLAQDGFFDEGIEEDLESERVNALYVMNHFLKAADVPVSSSEVINQLIADHWDHGPLEKTADWIRNRFSQGGGRVIEFGSSVGGLPQRLPDLSRYLGIDGSFTSVALARHLVLGAHYPRQVRIPGDLISGPVSLAAKLPAPAWRSGSNQGVVDFIFADACELAVKPESFDVSVALGLIDMLDDPEKLIRAQRQVIHETGAVVHASPYIWHEPVARALRERVFGQKSGSKVGNESQESSSNQPLSSVSVVQALYRNGGFCSVESLDAMPWVFFKHLRQLEVYSVHWEALCPNPLHLADTHES